MWRNSSITKVGLALLAVAMLPIALACDGQDPEATIAPTALPPAATILPMTEQPTATATASSTPNAVVPTIIAQRVAALPSPTPTPDTHDQSWTWMERYLRSPGYDPAWGEPVPGGTFVFGAQLDVPSFTPAEQGCCYYHGCFRGLAWNSLFRIDPWTGDLGAIEGDLVESWEMSEDGLTLEMSLREGVTFFHQIPEQSPLPAEYNGGLIAGDEFVCEDAVATYRRSVWPPEWEPRLTAGRADLSHLEDMSCPDGPRGHTFVMHFSEARGKTLGVLAGRAAVVMDKDVVDWLNDFGEARGAAFMDVAIPANFYSMHGTGPFMPVEINLSVSTDFVANPDYFREGLPLIDAYRNVVIKDIESRFTALATGKIHFMGEGSWSMTPGQAEQAIRDFPDRIVVNNQLNHWARTMVFGARAPWDDVRVRRAIHLALDRDQWVDFYRIAGYEGMKLANSFAPGTYYAPTDEEIRTWPGYRQPKDEDVAEANRLMDEVFGVGERPSAKCMASVTNSSDTDACLFVIDTLKKNLNMSVSSDFGDPASQAAVSDSGNFDMRISSYVQSTIGDPDDDLYNNYVPGLIEFSSRKIMEARWAEQPEVMAEVERMIRGQSSELDPIRRKQLARELDLKLLNDVSQYVVVGWSLIFPGWRSELKGWRGYDLYSYTKYAMHERMWID